MATVQDFNVSTTPVLLASGVGSVYLQRPSGGFAIALGDSSVTAIGGFVVTPPADGLAMKLDLESTDELWGICTQVNTTVVRVLHTR